MNEIIHFLAEEVRQYIRQEVEETKYFTIMAQLFFAMSVRLKCLNDLLAIVTPALAYNVLNFWLQSR
jgi:hypothetical protein